MEKKKDDIGSILKREACRIILERFQGISMNHAIDEAMTDDDSDMDLRLRKY